MIDLNRFSQEKTITVPILYSSFRYHGKKYKVSGSLDGWSVVTIKGNDCHYVSEAIPTGNEGQIIKGYVYEDNLVFQNFDVGKRKVGQEVMCKYYFGSYLSEFSSVEMILWEDGRLYYYQPNYTDFKILEVKSAIDNQENITSIKGITPELKTLSLFFSLRLQQIEELKKEKEKKDLVETLGGRLYLSFKRVGSELLDYSVNGNRITVDWSIGRQQFNSVIDKDTFRVIEAGFCLNGHDKEHTVHSISVLAQEYDKEDLIYKTRE